MKFKCIYIFEHAYGLTALTLKWSHIVTFIAPSSRRLYYWYYVLLVVFDTLSPPPHLYPRVRQRL